MGLNTVRCLVVFNVLTGRFSCSSADAGRSFYRAFNAVLGKVDTVASPEVIIELLKSKCIHILYYGSLGCPVPKSQITLYQKLDPCYIFK